MVVSHFPYPGQHGYPQSGGSTDQMMYSSNRSRCESGSSEGSRGSGSTGSGKSRRRSHRPRGCRGGSNRRRNNSNVGGEGKKRNPNNKHSSVGNYHGNGAIRGNKHSYNNITSSNYEIGGVSQASHYQLPCVYSDLSGSTLSTFPYSSDNSSDCFGRSMVSSYGEIMDHPVLQNSLSDSSNEFMPGHDDSQILPPMPRDAFQQQRPIPLGPNPYALNATVSARSASLPPINAGYNCISAALSYSAISLPPTASSSATDPKTGPSGILQPLSLSHTRGHSRHNINVTEIFAEVPKELAFVSLDKSAVTIPEEANDYRAERLEKQRQTVEGGSLFVTSPRSFLMGVKTSFHDSAPGAPTVYSF